MEKNVTYTPLRTSVCSLIMNFLQINAGLLNIIFCFAEIAAVWLTGIGTYPLPFPIMSIEKQWGLQP